MRADETREAGVGAEMVYLWELEPGPKIHGGYSIKGVQFLIDEEGKKTAVLIDLSIVLACSAARERDSAPGLGVTHKQSLETEFADGFAESLDVSRV